MKSRLDLIEETIKDLFESGPSLFPWIDEQSSLIHKLVEAIRDCFLDVDEDASVIPSQFLIYLNPEDRQFLEDQNDWLVVITKFFTEISAELGYKIEKKPNIQIVTRNSLKRGEVQVKAIVTSTISGKTDSFPVTATPQEELKQLHTYKSALILEDESLFYLEKPVINIGRNSSNHLVINDLRVSRNHAQIRTFPDGFIIFDIGSSGGTYINGERVSQHKLQAGDVISLAGIRLIYTEEQSNLNENPRQITSEIKPPEYTGNNPC